MNLYAYVSNNPLMLIDPLGLRSVARTLDWIQGGLDAIGIFDPSPISDGISGIISLRRRDYLGASASGIAIFPYLGDLIGKGAKYGLKYGDEVIGAANKASKKTVHKNSLDYVGETHVYRVKGPDGTYKIGESARGTRVRDGASIRAEQQARKLTRETGQPYRSDIRKTFPDKKSAREYETSLIKRFRRMFGDDTLPGNKTNR